MILTEGKIIPGVRIGKAVLGDKKENVLALFDDNFTLNRRPDGSSVYSYDNFKLWFNKEEKLQQIGVTFGFLDKYETIGIDSTLEDIKRLFGGFHEKYDDYFINGIEGLCFELGDMDEIDGWIQTEAPIEWIFVFTNI